MVDENKDNVIVTNLDEIISASDIHNGVTPAQLGSTEN